MRIWEVLKELEEDPTKLFMIEDYNYWGTNYEKQIPHALITMNNSKCIFYNGEIVKLGFAVLNCYYKPVKGFNKYLPEHRELRRELDNEK